MNLILSFLWYLLPANPMLLRIVKGGSVRQRDFYVRLGYLSAMIALVFFGLVSGNAISGTLSITEMAKAGAQTFNVISFGQVSLVCLIAPLYMSGAIAAERSGQTFNILMTTPLSNLQVVLGSLFGRLYFVLALLLSGLPIFVILLVFGGIDNTSVFQSFGIAAATALFVGSVAITISVLRIGGRLVVFSFVILSAGYLIGGYFIDSLFLRQFAAPITTTWLTPLHPLLTLEASILDNTYPTPSLDTLNNYSSLSIFYLTRPFETFIIITSTLSAIMMLFCAIMLRDITEILENLKRYLNKLVSSDEERDGRTVWKNPIAWREANARSQKNGKIFLLAAAALTILAIIPGFILLINLGSNTYTSLSFILTTLLLTGAWLLTLVGSALAGAKWRILTAISGIIPAIILLTGYHAKILPTPTPGPLAQQNAFHDFLWILMTIQLTIIVMVAIYVSSGSISKEREDGTLDLMLTTPINPKEYLWGKLRGLISFLSLLIAVPVLTLSVISIYVMIGSLLGWTQVQAQYFVGSANGTTTGLLILPEAPILLLITLVPFVAFCVILGMARSVKSKGVLGAVIPTFAIIALLTSIASICGFNALGSIPIIGPILNAFSPATYFMAITQPWLYIDNFNFNLMPRISIAIASLVSAAVYLGCVYATHKNIVKTFDFNVRKLSGNTGP